MIYDIRKVFKEIIIAFFMGMSHGRPYSEIVKDLILVKLVNGPKTLRMMIDEAESNGEIFANPRDLESQARALLDDGKLDLDERGFYSLTRSSMYNPDYLL